MPGLRPAAGAFTGTIAEIQGNGTERRQELDYTATTTGVVTARYPTGGFNGFYMQTAGTGGAADPTPDASDAIFVFVGAERRRLRSRPSATPPTSSAWSRSSTA